MGQSKIKSLFDFYRNSALIFQEDLFGWDQAFHDIREPELIREKKIIVHDDPLVDIIDESQPFDPRYFRPLMVTLRVAIHHITAHLLHVSLTHYRTVKVQMNVVLAFG